MNLTDSGVDRVEDRLGITNIYDAQNMEVLHHINQSLRAHTIFKRDRDYVVQANKVVIVDEHTGRLMSGRRWSDGLHQAVEAKEKLEERQEALVEREGGAGRAVKRLEGALAEQREAFDREVGIGRAPGT